MYGYLGLYFSGSTFYQTGDWAVQSGTDPQKTESISIRDIYTALRENDCRGMFWFSIDAPHSGKWALELKRDV